MKKITLLLGIMVVAFSSFATDVNEQVLSIFNKSYPDAQSVSWAELSNSYQVYFTRKNIAYRLLYDQEGNLALSIKYYNEDNLSPVILNKVRKAYPEFTINSIIEKSTDNSVEYHIILEGKKKLVTLKSDSLGYFEVESKYDKQD